MNYKYLLILVSSLFICCNTYDNKTIVNNNNLLNYYLNNSYHIFNIIVYLINSNINELLLGFIKHTLLLGIIIYWDNYT